MSASAELVRRTRWRWRYLWKQSRRRARSWHVTVPAGRSPSRSLWLCSWQRSGSTWLAEMLSAPATTRLVYEPANLSQEAFDGPRAAQLPLPTPDDPSQLDVLGALHGGLRGVWVDQLNTSFVVRHRVVKDVRGVAMAGSVRAASPTSPVVVLLRHPLAIARSVAELGWVTHSNFQAAIDSEVQRWCDAHVVVFRDPRLDDAFFVTYESLQRSPAETIRSILEYAGTFDQSWLSSRGAALDPSKRSATDFRAPRGVGDAGWGDLAPDVVAHAGATLRAWGLSDLYDEAPECHLEANDFVRQFRARERC